MTASNDSSFRPLVSRRGFLGSSALAAGGFLLSGRTQLQAAGPGEVGETDHFWYRLAPADGPYIDTQRGHLAFGFQDGELRLSEDTGKTWPHRAAFAETKDILFSSILENGRVVFATARHLFLAEPRLASVREIRVLDQDGDTYRPHPLREDKAPGWYFYSLDGRHTFDVEGREMLIWGNYCNVGTGPVPSNIYYSADGGETVKIAYSFGQNPAFQYPVNERKEWLGNPDNPVVCRHVHSVAYNPAENAFYACTGDIDRKNGAGLECHWLRGVWDAASDTWDWKVVVSSDSNSRFKSGGINFVDGQVYWVADANGPKAPSGDAYDRGIFRCAPADLPDKSKHSRLYDARYEMAAMTIDGEVMLAPAYGNANPCDCGFLISTDLGRNWGVYDLSELGDRSGVRVNPRNADGWFRIDLRRHWIDRGEVLFLKPKI